MKEADNSISQFDVTPSNQDLFGGIYVGKYFTFLIISIV